MVARGRVQNGVIVLEGGIRLPEGQVVTVLAGEPAQAAVPRSGLTPHSVLDIPPVSLGRVLSTPEGDDLLGEMLEGRS